MNAIEKVLVAQSNVATNAGHPNLRGGPREWFVRDFLESHLPSTLEIGQGEVIGASSAPSPRQDSYRPQVDIILYRRDFPKLAYSKNDFAFLVEGTVATVECKSVLTKNDLRQVGNTHRKHLSLANNLYMEVKLPRDDVYALLNYPISYVIAFDSPNKISTVASWLPEIAQEMDTEPEQTVDVIVVFGKGVVWRINAFPTIDVKPYSEGRNWAYAAQEDNNLSFFFSHMLMWTPAASRLPSIDYHSPYIELKGNCGTV